MVVQLTAAEMCCLMLAVLGAENDRVMDQRLARLCQPILQLSSNRLPDCFKASPEHPPRMAVEGRGGLLLQ